MSKNNKMYFAGSKKKGKRKKKNKCQMLQANAYQQKKKNKNQIEITNSKVNILIFMTTRALRHLRYQCMLPNRAMYSDVSQAIGLLEPATKTDLIVMVTLETNESRKQGCYRDMLLLSVEGDSYIHLV